MNNYRVLDTCANCEHCFGWEGSFGDEFYCNIEITDNDAIQLNGKCDNWEKE